MNSKFGLFNGAIEMRDYIDKIYKNHETCDTLIMKHLIMKDIKNFRPLLITTLSLRSKKTLEEFKEKAKQKKLECIFNYATIANLKDREISRAPLYIIQVLFSSLKDLIGSDDLEQIVNFPIISIMKIALSILIGVYMNSEKKTRYENGILYIIFEVPNYCGCDKPICPIASLLVLILRNIFEN